MKRAAILWLLAWLVILTLIHAAYRTVYPIEQQLIIDAAMPSPRIAPCPIDPRPASPNPLKPKTSADA